MPLAPAFWQISFSAIKARPVYPNTTPKLIIKSTVKKQSNEYVKTISMASIHATIIDIGN